VTVEVFTMRHKVNADESCKNLSRKFIHILHNESRVDTMAPSVAEGNGGSTYITTWLRSQFTAHITMYPCTQINQPMNQYTGVCHREKDWQQDHFSFVYIYCQITLCKKICYRSNMHARKIMSCFPWLWQRLCFLANLCEKFLNSLIFMIKTRLG